MKFILTRNMVKGVSQEWWYILFSQDQISVPLTPWCCTNNTFLLRQYLERSKEISLVLTCLQIVMNFLDTKVHTAISYLATPLPFSQSIPQSSGPFGSHTVTDSIVQRVKEVENLPLLWQVEYPYNPLNLLSRLV